eukprot:g55989.t1
MGYRSRSEASSHTHSNAVGDGIGRNPKQIECYCSQSEANRMLLVMGCRSQSEANRMLLMAQDDQLKQAQKDLLKALEDGDDTDQYSAFFGYTTIPKVEIPHGATAQVISNLHLDRTRQLEALFAQYKQDKAMLLGELQCCFVLFLIGFSTTGFEHWKRLVCLLTSCEAGLSAYPGFFAHFTAILHAQIQEVPSDFFVDLLSQDNFLISALRVFFELADLGQTTLADLGEATAVYYYYCYTIAMLLLCYCYAIALLLLYYCYAFAILLLCYCYTIAILLLCYCYTIAILLLYYSYTIAILLLCHCFAIAMLLLCYCYAIAILLLYYCYTIAIRLLCY